jgi:hypothetical protein
MPANVDGMVREGVSAYRAGRKEEARALLLRAVEIDQYNEQAWLWLSAVVESVDEQRTCLENVLTINPGNERAKQGLHMLSQKGTPAPSSKAATAQADDVLASTSFTDAPKTNPFAVDADELPSSIEWDAPPTASSSASSTRKVNEPSSAEYDDWVTNLNLGGSGSQSDASIEAATQFASKSFTDDEDDLFSFDTPVGEDDDLFASGPFSAPETPLPKSAPPPPPPLRDTAPPSSPSSPSSSRASAGPKLSDALLDDIENDTLDAAFLDEFDNAPMEKLDSSEFFQYLPKEVKATRLPGTRERYPIVLILGLIVVALLNIGAVYMFVTNLTAP